MSLPSSELIERYYIPLEPQIVVHTSTLVRESYNRQPPPPQVNNMDPQEIEDLRDEIMKFLQALPGPETSKLKDLMDKLAEQMIETQSDGNDVLFCGSDGKTIIKAVHFPRSSLGSDGPVILPSADSKVILAAFSDEYVQTNLDEVRNVFQDPSVREHQWEQFLNGLATQVSRAHAENGDFDWSGSLGE